MVFCLALAALPFLLASPVQLIVGCLILGAAAGRCIRSLVRAGKTFSGQKLIMINALLGFSGRRAALPARLSVAC